MPARAASAPTRPSSSRSRELRLQPRDGALPRPPCTPATPTRRRSVGSSRRTSWSASSASPPPAAGASTRAAAAELLRGTARTADPSLDRRRRRQPFRWPDGFARIPDEDWVDAPIDAFGLHYDTVENHGWYRNLDLTVEELADDLRRRRHPDRLLRRDRHPARPARLRIFDRQVGTVIVDSSPKFLRVALDRFRHDERVAFRRLRYLKDERRLQYVDEVLGDAFPERAATLVSTNAIHLYDDLENTLRAWTRVLKPGGLVRINSGNIRNPRADANEWIIDETVYVVHEVAAGLVRTDPALEPYRSVLRTQSGSGAYLDWRDRVFLPPRPLDRYIDALAAAGFTIDEVTERTIEADVAEWYEFLAAYADAVLGWVGGSVKVDGVTATPEAAADRLDLLRESLNTIFGGRPTFRCCWTYISAVAPASPSPAAAATTVARAAATVGGG